MYLLVQGVGRIVAVDILTYIRIYIHTYMYRVLDALSEYVRFTRKLEDINLSHMGLDDRAGKMLADAISDNQHLRLVKLNMSDNR